MHLLFWLSLFPFATGWMGENNFATWPVVLYGGGSFMAGMAYYLLAHSLASLHGRDSTLAIALGKNRKGILSVVIYAMGIGLSFVNPWLAMASYFAVACMWFIPDRRIERKINSEKMDSVSPDSNRV